MSVARSVAEVLRDHVTLQIEGIDRMYLNAYIPKLQYEMGVVGFFRKHLDYQFASSALMDPISKRFIAAIERFVLERGVDLITFKKGQRKDTIAAGYRAKFAAEEGVLFVGKAQEKATVFRTEKRKHPETGRVYPWLVRTTALVNQYYFYAIDRDFGPFFLKFCSYFPYTAKLCINGHEYLKWQLTREGIGFEALDNGLASCDNPARAQAICDGLADTDCAIGSIEDHQHRDQLAPFHREVDASPLAGFFECARAVHLLVELPADEQQRIANGLGIEPGRGSPPEKPIVAVGVESGLVGRGGGLVHGTRHDQLVDRFQLPAIADQLVREVIEQLRMRWPFATNAEIARRGHDAPPHMMLPKAIHDHSGQEHASPVVHVCHPIRKGAATIRKLRLFHRLILPAIGFAVQNLQEPHRCRGFFLIRIATPEKVRLLQHVFALRMQTHCRHALRRDQGLDHVRLR